LRRVKKNQLEDPQMKQMHDQHKEALKRLKDIRAEIQRLEKETKDLETESYVKSRQISSSYGKRDEEMIKECGKRLKEIQARQREIESTIKALVAERERISK
jgi:archaellum component FlaC